MNVRAIAHSWMSVVFMALALLVGVAMQVQTVAAGVSDTSSDMQCIPAQPTSCPCGQIMGPKGCISNGNKFMCPCSQTDNGFSTVGVCLADQKCHANSTGGKSPDSGLSQLGQILGQLLGKLGQGGGGGGGGDSGSQPNASSACTSYTPTSDPTQVGVNPCVYYVPGGTTNTTTCTDKTASNYGATGICIYVGTTGTTSCSLAQELAGGCSNNGGGGGTTTVSTTLSASPLSGSAPLSVSFTVNQPQSSATYMLDPGDGSGAQSMTGTHFSYTYTAAGTYTAALTDSSGNPDGTATISVTNPGGSTDNTNSASGLTQVFNSIGGLFQGSSSTAQSGQGFSSFPGVLGNILLDQNGATIYASTINSANNSQTSSFYGSDTLGQPQGIVSSLCQNRPWASNFLANIIPPSFFDSLCQWGGFQVGATQQQSTTTQPQVTLSQKPSRQQATTTAATTTSTVQPQAIIWAVPASVPLGARTSVFWNSQGVTQCTESSPDGSFSEKSLSGAAATVPITGDTTFTISCLDQSGNPITDYVTVSLSN